MANLGYSKGPDDDGEPSGVVVRRKKNGSVDLTVLDGDDDEINRGLAGLIIGIHKAGGLTQFMAIQKAMLDADGGDISSDIDDLRAGKDWKDKDKDKDNLT